MSANRAAVFVEALKALEIEVWRQTRYGFDTGTSLWCSNGSIVNVPDDWEAEWICQAKGAEALQPRLTAEVGPRLEVAAAAAAAAATAPAPTADLSPGQGVLLEAGERLRREGFDEALMHSRRIFANIMKSKFGPLPPMVAQRIDAADFTQLERWSERLFTMPRAILVVV